MYFSSLRTLPHLYSRNYPQNTQKHEEVNTRKRVRSNVRDPADDPPKTTGKETDWQGNRLRATHVPARERRILAVVVGEKVVDVRNDCFPPIVSLSAKISVRVLQGPNDLHLRLPLRLRLHSLVRPRALRREVDRRVHRFPARSEEGEPRPVLHELEISAFGGRGLSRGAGVKSNANPDRVWEKASEL